MFDIAEGWPDITEIVTTECCDAHGNGHGKVARRSATADVKMDIPSNFEDCDAKLFATLDELIQTSEALATLLPPSALLLVLFVSTSLRTDLNTNMYDFILYTILQQPVKHLSRKSSRNTAAASK